MKTTGIIYSIMILIVLLFVQCTKMEDNYADYLEINKVYSPKVINLVAEPGLMEVQLTWDNPAGDVAKKIVIDYSDSIITTASMIDSIHITGLAIKGYDFSVFTMDEFGNLSVPETVTVFPNGE